MSEERTISKNFNDDEVIGRLPNGDLYLKEGVKRLKYDYLSPDDEQNINYSNLSIVKVEEKKKQNKDWDE